MRELILFMHMSLDGYVGGADKSPPSSAGDGGVFEKVVPELIEGADTLLLGRLVADELVGYWLNAEDNEPGLSAGALAHARWLTSAHKVVLSSAEEQLPWADSELALVRNDDDMLRSVLELKQRPGSNIVVYGGVRTAQDLVRLGLIDEYQLVVHPVALGDGGALFKKVPERLDLTLLEVIGLGAGTAFLRYRPLIDADR